MEFSESLREVRKKERQPRFCMPIQPIWGNPEDLFLVETREREHGFDEWQEEHEENEGSDGSGSWVDPTEYWKLGFDEDEGSPAPQSPHDTDQESDETDIPPPPPPPPTRTPASRTTSSRNALAQLDIRPPASSSKTATNSLKRRLDEDSASTSSKRRRQLASPPMSTHGESETLVSRTLRSQTDIDDEQHKSHTAKEKGKGRMSM